MDTVINSQGRRIIDFCKMCNLKILNGRLGADANIGKYTCYVYNGSSTVDYFMSSAVLFDIVYDLQVKDINEFSYHCLVELQLRLSNNPRQTTVRKAEKVTWDAEKIITIDKIFPVRWQSINLTIQDIQVIKTGSSW